jgi:hypothetical protein
MKLLTEYLEHAITFERMASEASDPNLKESMRDQARAYRRMAAKRAKMLGLPEPSPPGS